MAGRSSRPKPETIQRISNATFPALALLSGMQLDLFTTLEGGPKRVSEIAAGLDQGRLERLLFALVSAGLVELEGERFANTPEADRYLVRGRPDYMGEAHWLYSDIWRSCLKTTESIRSGSPQAKHDFSNMPEDELAAFLQGLAPGAAAAGRGLAKHRDFSDCETVADVGGGSGALAMALCEAFPHLKASVVELPAVVPITRRLLDEADAGERVGVIAADLVGQALPGSFDAAVLRNFLQILSADDAAQALANVVQGVKAGGWVYVIGIGVVDDSRIAPAEAVGLDLVFLNVYDEGRAYTEREYREWFDEVGLAGFERVRLEGGYSLIVGRKPD